MFSPLKTQDHKKKPYKKKKKNNQKKPYLVHPFRPNMGFDKFIKIYVFKFADTLIFLTYEIFTH